MYLSKLVNKWSENLIIYLNQVSVIDSLNTSFTQNSIFQMVCDENSIPETHMTGIVVFQNGESNFSNFSCWYSIHIICLNIVKNEYKKVCLHDIRIYGSVLVPHKYFFIFQFRHFELSIIHFKLSIIQFEVYNRHFKLSILCSFCTM